MGRRAEIQTDKLDKWMDRQINAIKSPYQNSCKFVGTGKRLIVPVNTKQLDKTDHHDLMSTCHCLQGLRCQTKEWLLKI